MRLTTGVLFILALTACEAEEEVVEELPVRAIKYMALAGVAEADERVLAGVVEAGTSSNVAFEIGGQVVEMAVDVGAVVEAGQFLAALDPEPYELQVQQAEFALRQANAILADARSKYEQQAQLWEGRFTTKTALDTATSNLRNAEGQVGIARSQLDLQKRDLAKTRLTAPFGGQVAQQTIEVFEEVTAGTPIYILQTDGENEVSVSVPETLISKISLGQEVAVRFPPLGDAEVLGRITELAPRAGEANAYPATIRLAESPSGLRAGMSARIAVSFATEATGRAFSVPIGALKGRSEGPGQALVYIFDEAAGVVRERPVRVVGIDGNTPQIVGELAPGEIVATAGVGYMYDGMEVRLLDPSTLF